MANWRYKLKEDYNYFTPELKGVIFENEWTKIDGEGNIWIKQDYAWDGMSPTIQILGFKGAYIAPWQGGRDETHPEYPISWEASLVHDVLCQWRNHIPVTKQQSVRNFNRQLKDCNFITGLRYLYVKAVDWFGPQVFLGDQMK